MATRATRAERQVKSNRGRIVMLENQIARLERRIEKLEGRTTPAAAADRIAKLAARVDRNKKDIKKNADDVRALQAVREAAQALVRSFKQTPGAPFPVWRSWMLSTLRKYGLYRRQMFR